MAALEYVALTLLVCAVVAVAGAEAGAGEIGAAVGAQARRALCLVSGGDCLGPDGPRPCVVRADGRSRDARLSVLVLRLRDGRLVLREQRSDGTVRVTVMLADAVGAAVSAGARVAIGGRALNATVEAGGDAGLAYGRVFTLVDGAAADRLIERLEREDAKVAGALGGLLAFARGDADGDEDARFAELRGSSEASAALRALGIDGRATALHERAVGLHVDRRTGTRTVVLRLDGEITAMLSAPLGKLAQGRAGSADVELTFDRNGRADALTVRRTGGVAGTLRLPGLTRRRGDRLELEARLDLTDDDVRRLIDRLLARDLGAARAIAQRLADGARLDARLYATSREERTVGGSIALGARVGGEVTTVIDSARLVDAVGREPGLGWMRRLDCVRPA